MLKHIPTTEIDKAIYSFMSELTENVGSIEINAFCKIMLDSYEEIKHLLYHSQFKEFEEFADMFSLPSFAKRGKLEIKGGNITLKLVEDK